MLLSPKDRTPPFNNRFILIEIGLEHKVSKLNKHLLAGEIYAKK